MAETASPDSTDTTAKKEGNNAESEDERLRSASLAGSIHELQGGEVEDDTEVRDWVQSRTAPYLELLGAVSKLYFVSLTVSLRRCPPR